MTKEQQTTLKPEDQEQATENANEARQQVAADGEGTAAPQGLPPEGAEAVEAVDQIESETAQSAEALTQALEQAQRKADAHWNALLRAQAELDNLRKRSARDVEQAHKYGLERFISELLPVTDSLELGVAAAQDDAADVRAVREGMELTLKMLKQAMAKYGVEQVNPEEQPFNPEYHEAMSVQETDKVPSGTVLTVVQRGYLLNGRLVRPAMVIVAK